MLQAIIAYMPVIDTNASIGSINYSRDEKVRLAKESINFVCDNCGPIMAIHKEMLAVEATRISFCSLIESKEAKEKAEDVEPNKDSEENKVNTKHKEDEAKTNETKGNQISAKSEAKEEAKVETIIKDNTQTKKKPNTQQNTRGGHNTDVPNIATQDERKTIRKHRNNGLSNSTKTKIKEILQTELHKRTTYVNIAFAITIGIYIAFLSGIFID